MNEGETSAVADVVEGVAYSAVGADDPKDRLNVRSAVMSIWDNVELGKSAIIYGASLRKGDDSFTLDTFRAWLMYGAEHPSRGRKGRRKMPVDVKAMVEAWVPIIKGLSTAHDKATLDRCEFESETHLQPLLAAPVRQLREFYSTLVAALKADPQVPFFIWALFESWGDVILKHAPDADVRELKDQLAEEIAGMVEKDVQPDLKAALTGALRWRSTETLEKVKTAVASGAKPRLKGRESCLFLCVPLPDGREETVML